ncbi:Mitochondrial Carrier (MC) Family [Phytophthora palmivora]|uniref:Mitochondrial Carrier (MC) Family n=1 Tax=Phytophthora palmivora TaxID=4796 RepID=A0A2P4YHX3_9STRA|nr:Mitochondrial Carrier (MC) Family [Phytophthora palmivora]
MSLQTQGTTNAYAGVTDAFRRIATEEGVAALWKGAVPALSSSIIENSVLFSANGFAKRAVLALHAKQRAEHEGDYQLTTLDEALMGAFAGCFSATAITMPENIKCKLQFQRGHLGEGPKILGKESKNDLNPVAILTSGGLAGATSWSIMFPVDVLKSRMQTASSTGPLSLRGAFRAVYSEFGIHGFYRGWSAAVLRAFPANGSLFLGVEMTHLTMDLRDAEHAKTLSSGQNRRGSIGTVDENVYVEETFLQGGRLKAVAQLLALKSVELTQLQRTHDEYVKSSCEYERELEIEVDRYEKKTQQLESAALQLERDKSDLNAV